MVRRNTPICCSEVEGLSGDIGISQATGYKKHLMFKRTMGDDEPIKSKKPRLSKAADAVLAGDVNSLRAILEDENSKDEWLLEPLDVDRVKKVEPVDVDGRKNGWNIMHLAVANDQVPCIEVLLEKAPKLATSLTSAYPLHTPLSLAVEKQKELDTIKALLNGGAKKEATAVLWKAFQANRPGSYPLDLVKLLIANGATHSTCLRGPIIGKNFEVVKFMIERGCKPHAYYIDDHEKEFPLYAAAEKGCLDIVKMLIKLAPTAVHARTQDKSTALFAAARNGHADCVEALIAAGSDVKAQDEDGRCAIYLAAAYGHASVIKILLKQKAVKAMAVKMRNWRSELHPLTVAVTSGSAETVRLLTESKFLRYDLSSDNEEEKTVELIDDFCIEWGDLDLISYALNEDKGDTVGIVNALLDAGFPVEGHYSTQPLSVAVMQMQNNEEKMEKIVCRILEEGANLKYTKEKCKNLPPEALVVAVQINSEKTLQILLQYWDKPPAELLATYDNYPDVSPLVLEQWFPVLFQYGIPHGHPMISIVEKKLQKRMSKEYPSSENQATVKKQELLSSFLEQMKVPSSLKKLSRFAVRSYFGKEASKANVTLPTLLSEELGNSSLVPSDLLPFILLNEP